MDIYTPTTQCKKGFFRCVAGLGLFLSLVAQGPGVFGQQVDTTAVADTTQAPVPGRQAQPQEGQVDFQASDSLVFDFRKDRIATLYGSAQVTHQSGNLAAGTVSMNLDRHLVSAMTTTPEDTLSRPVLTRDGEKIRSNKINFNYETQKGRFEVARVSIEQGNVIGTTVKNTTPHTVFLEDAIYSTCQLDHPHYYIKARRMKVVDQDEIFFTNARLYILDIPYPLVFPFGYLPAKIERRQSGLLEPTYSYQQKQTRGLGIQNLGWFQYFSDYLTGRASVDIFTSGTFYLNTRADYAKRNSFNGNITIGYSRERGLEPTDPGFSVNTQKRLNIVHSQNFSPYAGMSANIDLRTADYFKRNSFNPSQRVETSTSSNLSYRYRHPENLYNFSISARQNRNFSTNITRLSGPNMNFSLKNISPFAGSQVGRGESTWYENISIRYQNTFQSDYNFTPIRGDSARINWFEALLDPGKYREATGNSDHYQYGFRQQANVSFGKLIPSRHLNLSAALNYNEYWFPTSTRKTFDPDSNAVIEEQVRGFTSARDFSTGLNLSTTIYGMSNARVGSIEGFRHTLRPSLSFGYRPDFSDDYWGYFREVQVDTTGRTQTYSIFENEIFRGPSRGEQRALGINISNMFEARQVKRDSTGEKSERTLRLIDQLDFNTSYNFAADSLNLSDLSASFSSRAVEGLNIRANARFNFYERDSTGRKVNEFLASSGQLMEMTDFSINASTSFSGGGGQGFQINQTPYYPASYDPFNQSIFNAMDSRFNQAPVQPINSQWSFSLNFRYSWRLNPNGANSKSASINAENIQFNLTPQWSVRTQLGYDFIQKNISYSQFSLQRNLHCWSLSFTMNPFGDSQYYFFKLSVNSGQIQSILQKLPLLNNLERSSSSTGRSPISY